VRRALPALLLAAVLGSGLAGCSSSPGPEVPAEDAFATGTCRTAAPDVRAVGEAIPDLGDGGKVDGEVKDSLREAQDRLAALADGAEPDLQAPLRGLVEKIGIVRIRADGNTYETSQGEVLTTAYERVLDACTTD
jgi:hypothetical protein